MSVYGAVTAGAEAFKIYQGKQSQLVERATKDPTLILDDPQQASIHLFIANQNLAFANDVMGLILKNIASLQP
ncbi:MAG: hypothetical protein JWM80_1087 [Cyanobacteria bacterium RYN_339]|nr:hypothetical protein [Cyanobacteria bacterium RYN_339]